ncbi:MAG TPA: caspase family protein [Lichenihabitans sp.]|nr:caspase family protein [Lichenihabitans sp.]
MQRVWGAVIIVVLTFLTASAAWADKRVALVIGNSNYQAVAQLPNPANDARAFAQVLKDAHFDSVVVKTDLGIDAFRQALRDFTALAADADTAVFFYAGHGLEVGGSNLLVPVDAKLRTDLDAEDETVSIDRVLRALDPVKHLRLVILDACRDNPFVASMKHTGSSRGISRGLQRIDAAPADTMIAFATEPGSVAADGDGRHSPFTAALMADVAVPGLDLRLALGKVRDDVLKATGGKQRPYVTGSLGGANQPLVPADGAAPPSEAPRQAEAPSPPPPDSAAGDFKFAESIGTSDGWQAFLRVHPDGPLADVARDRVAALKTSEARPPTPPPADDQQARLEPQPTAPPRALPPVPSSGRYVVGGLDPNGDNFLALRTAPNGSAAMLRQLPPGARLSVGERSGGWLHVATEDGENGWVSGRYVLPYGSAAPRPAAPAQGYEGYSYVTGLDPNGDNFLALKAAPDIHSGRLMKMGPGTKLRVLGHNGSWAQVQLLDGTSGWASSRYIGCCTAAR